MDAFGKLMLGLISLPLLAIWRGYVLSILWRWFFVPLGAPVIGVALAIGVSMTAGYITKEHMSTSKEDDDLGLVGILFMGFLLPVIVLFMGWVTVQFT